MIDLKSYCEGFPVYKKSMPMIKVKIISITMMQGIDEQYVSWTRRRGTPLSEYHIGL